MHGFNSADIVLFFSVTTFFPRGSNFSILVVTGFMLAVNDFSGGEWFYSGSGWFSSGGVCFHFRGE